MRSPLLLSCCLLANFLPAAWRAATVTAAPTAQAMPSPLSEFTDEFADGDPAVNPGEGGGWVDASQAEPALFFEESNSQLLLYSATGAWNIGALKTENSFSPGTAFKVTLASLNLVQDSADRADRGNARVGAAIAAISLAAASNSKPFPSTFHNDELGAVGVEVGPIRSGWPTWCRG